MISRDNSNEPSSDQNFDNIFKIGFDSSVAALMGDLSNASYLSFLNEDKVRNVLEKMGFKLVKLIEDKESNTQAILVANEQYAVLAFRGTETDQIEDIITDLAVELEDGWHSGFRRSYLKVKDQVLMGLDEVADLPLYVTGHSLGGALAKVTTLDLSAKILACYTFGSPAICTNEKSKLNKVPTYLIVNNGDVVARITMVGPLLAFLVICTLKLLSSIYKIFKPLEKNWSLFSKLSLLAECSAKLQHFGDIFVLSEDGDFFTRGTAKSSMNLFWAVITKDIKKVANEHLMKNYNSKLSNLSRPAMVTQIVTQYILPNNDNDSIS